jgi:hypothetical protein
MRILFLALALLGGIFAAAVPMAYAHPGQGGTNASCESENHEDGC